MTAGRSRAGTRRGLAPLADAVRTQLWPLPVTTVVLAIALGTGLIALDERARSTVPAAAQFLLFGGDASAARSILEAMAGSLITVTSLTFSLTVVTLQLASSQFSPRLLRTFAADRFVQATLALFLSTFVFALTVLRSVRDGDETSDGFVPRFSVTWAFVMTIACVVGLVLFLAHLAREIRVETMLDAVRRESARTVGRMITDEDVHREVVVPSDAVPVAVRRSGFLLSVDLRRLRTLAE